VDLSASSAHRGVASPRVKVYVPLKSFQPPVLTCTPQCRNAGTGKKLRERITKPWVSPPSNLSADCARDDDPSPSPAHVPLKSSRPLVLTCAPKCRNVETGEKLRERCTGQQVDSPELVQPRSAEDVRAREGWGEAGNKTEVNAEAKVGVGVEDKTEVGDEAKVKIRFKVRVCVRVRVEVKVRAKVKAEVKVKRYGVPRDG
jgi:hypothetical protein